MRALGNRRGKMDWIFRGEGGEWPAIFDEKAGLPC